MKALSIKQPWASLIAHGIKDIENRTWKTNFRGRIFIHASAKEAGRIAKLINGPQLDFLMSRSKFSHLDTSLIKSAIIGEVDIIDCVVNHPSIWAEQTPDCVLGGCSKCEVTGFCPETGNHLQSETGKPTYNWVLANPVLYEKPILNVKGKLSFWEFENPELLK